MIASRSRTFSSKAPPTNQTPNIRSHDTFLADPHSTAALLLQDLVVKGWGFNFFVWWVGRRRDGMDLEGNEGKGGMSFLDQINFLLLLWMFYMYLLRALIALPVCISIGGVLRKKSCFVVEFGPSRTLFGVSHRLLGYCLHNQQPSLVRVAQNATLTREVANSSFSCQRSIFRDSNERGTLIVQTFFPGLVFYKS